MLPKYFIIVFVLVISIFASTTVFALTPTVIVSPSAIPSVTPASKKESDKPTKMKKFENRQATLEARMEMRKLRFEERLKLIEQHRENLKTRLETFKDQRKNNIILRLDSKIASISSRRTERMGNAVDKLDKLLDTIKNKAENINGCDKSELSDTILLAEEAVSSASAAIDAQINKTYTIDTTSEETAFDNIGQTIKLLTEDLRNTHKYVQEAKLAVVKAAVDLRKLKACIKINISPSGTITP